MSEEEKKEEEVVGDKILIKRVDETEANEDYILNVDGSMSDDDVEKGIIIEQEKLNSDIATRIEDIGRYYFEKEEEEKAKSEIKSFENFSNNYYVHPSIIKLVGVYREDKDGELSIPRTEDINKSSLEILERAEVEGEKKVNFYITKISTEYRGRVNTHFLLIIKDNKSKEISIVDSSAGLGFAEPIREAIKTALKDNVVDYNFTNNEQTLQYSSGVCETYAIKLAFFIIRNELFNNISARLDETRIKFLDEFVHIGINELPFGMKKDNEGAIIKDLSIIDERSKEIDSLQENLKKMIEHNYSGNKKFNKKFDKARRRDKVFLKQCVRHILLPHIDKMVESCVTQNKEKGLVISKNKINKYINSEENKKDFEDLGIKDKGLVSTIVQKRITIRGDDDSFLKYIFEEVPFKSIKVGFMLREAIKLKQKIEENKTSIATP